MAESRLKSRLARIGAAIETERRAVSTAFVLTLTFDERRALIEFIARHNEHAGLSWRGDPVCEDAFRRASAVVHSLPFEDAIVGPFEQAEARAACLGLLDTVRERGYPLWQDKDRRA